LRQKAYMLFYVRDRVMSPIKQKDIGAASLSNTKMIPEKIACVDGTTLNGLVEPAMEVPSLSGEVTKLQENVDVGQPSNIRNTLQNPCSNTRNNTEVTEASTLQNSVSAYVQKTPFEDQCSNAHNKSEVTDASMLQNNEPDSVEKTHLPDQCSHAHNKTEVNDASTSHNNEAASAQIAPFMHLNGAAMVSTVEKQIESDSKTETMPPGQHDICMVRAASCDPKATKEPLQELQLQSDGSQTDSGKDMADAADPICSGAVRLFGANDQATESQPDPSCIPIPDNDTETSKISIFTEVTCDVVIVSYLALNIVLSFQYLILNCLLST
jgi:hypothetical protein